MTVDKYWNSKIAAMWLEEENWSIFEAAKILYENRNPASRGPFADNGSALFEFEVFLGFTLADGSENTSVSRNFSPRRWIHLWERAGQKVPKTIADANHLSKAIRPDHLLSHQRIMVALSSMGPLDLLSRDAARKILAKTQNRSEGGIRRIIKAAAKAVAEADPK